MNSDTNSDEFYLRRGDKFFLTNESATEVHPKLPPGFYTVDCSEVLGYYFEVAKPFELPPRYYGELNGLRERIKTTFKHRLETQHRGTGVKLSGEKGSGKSLLAKVISTDLVAEGLPVVMVNFPFHDDKFKRLISSLGPAVIIFDEFEKTYARREHQDDLLTLLDGVYVTQGLFFVVINEENKLTDALQNRPNRLFYSIEYKGLSTEFITDYCNENLIRKDHLTSVLSVVAFFVNFNFDMLQGLVEEMNRYNESAIHSVKYLNVKNDIFRAHELYKVTATYNGKELKLGSNSARLKGHPLSKPSLSIYIEWPAKDRDRMSSYLHLTQDNISDVDQENQRFTYRSDNFEVVYTRSGDTGWKWGPEMDPVGDMPIDV